MMRASQSRARKERILLEGCAQVCFAYSQVARRKFAPGAGRKSPRTVPFCPCHIFLFCLQLCTQAQPSPTLCPNLEPECLIWNKKTEADIGHLKFRFLP